MRKAILWGNSGCPNCEKEKELLRADGYEVEVRDIAACDRKNPDDLEAFTQLQMQHGVLPVVKLGDEFVVPMSVSASLEMEDHGA